METSPTRPTRSPRESANTAAGASGEARRLGWLIAAAAAGFGALAPSRLLDGVLPPRVFLLAHTTLELVAAVVGFTIFAAHWKAASARGLRDGRAIHLGAVFLVVATLDLAHALAYQGMPGLWRPGDPDQAIYYWLAGRMILVGGILLAMSGRVGSLRPRRTGEAVAASAVILLVLLAAAPILQTPGLFFDPATGLTPLKVALEWGLTGVSLAGGLWLWRRWRILGDRTALPLAAALALTALSEAFFTLYRDVHDLANLLGHLYKVSAYAVAFQALFVETLLRPYRALDQTARVLAARNDELAALRTHVEGELAHTIDRLAETTAAEREARLASEASAARLRAMQTVTDAALGHLQLPDMLAELLGRVVAVLDADAAGILLLDPMSRRLQLHAVHPPAAAPDQPPRLHFGEGLAGRAAQAQVPVALGDEDEEGHQLALGEGFRSALAVPMVLHEHPVGVLEVASTRSQAFATEDLDLLQRVADRVASAVERARLEATREDLLRGVSHDLRSPLTAITLQAERLRQPRGPDTVARAAGAIQRSVRQMDALIRDLVALQQLEGGALKVDLQAVDLAALAAELLDSFEGVVDARRVEISLPPGLPPVLADPDALTRVLSNLVGNAIKYAPGSVIRLSAEAGHHVTILVSDQGPGIAPQHLPHLFDRYYRAGAQGKGLGLGLWICRGLVEAQNGEITVESAPGAGSSFRVRLAPAA